MPYCNMQAVTSEYFLFFKKNIKMNVIGLIILTLNCRELNGAKQSNKNA